MTAHKQKEELTCYHCGDNCSSASIHIDEKVFCCQGCKTVYEILSRNNLSDYYSRERSPGLKREKSLFSDYSYLDIGEIKEQLLNFSGGGNERVTLGAPGMHCSSCIWLLENLQQLNPSIVKSEVNFLKKEVSLQYKTENFSLREAAELLDSIGYKPLIELKENERVKANKRKDLSYIYKLGISGFAFGNIMLLSFPEYFSGGMYDDVDFGPFFGYVNLLLALPVFFYCSSSYFLSAWKGLKNRYLNIDVPISLGILVLFLRSSYEVLTQSGPGYFDSMTGLVFFLLIGRWFQNRTYQALSFERNYRNYFPLSVSKISQGKIEHILLKDLSVGEEVIIHNGEIIPADSSLLSGKANIDYSFVTGESLPVRVETGGRLFAGGRQRGEQIQVKIEKEFSQSYLMQLWKNEKKPNRESNDMTFLIDRISHYFTAIILLIATITGVYWWLVDKSLAFQAIGSILIIACPCALALTIPFTFGNGVRIFERAGFYLRDARLIEIISGIDTIVFDKTGTITTQQNKAIEFIGNELYEQEKIMLKSLTRHSAHPLSRTIYNLLDDVREENVIDFEELPGKGLKGICLGRNILLGSASFTGMSETVKGSAVYVQIDGNSRGLYAIGNEYRNGLPELVSKLKKNYSLMVITGDGNSEKNNLIKQFGEHTELKFSMDPFQKRSYIEDLKKKGIKVMMIGDGLNDSGAISESDIGVSISDDIFGFLPSCDAILEAGNFTILPDILKFSKSMKKLVIAGFIISFLYNIIGLSFAVQGLLSPIIAAILMPLSSATVVAFAMVSTNISAGNLNSFGDSKHDKNHSNL